MQKKQLIYRKPSYADGQLLMADDFIREQKYHAQARERHSLHLHGWGVVRGLEVTRAGDHEVGVSAGLAIDGRGREILLERAEVLDVQGAPVSSQLSVTIGHRAEWPDKGGERDRSIDCYAALRVSGGIEEHDVQLATVRIDDRGRIAVDGIDTAGRRLQRTPRVGWLRMPFRPIMIPPDQKDAQPPFRVGPTEAAAHKEYDGKPNARGAAGTMAILLPPQAIRIHRLRVAGAATEQKIQIELFKGGWDASHKKHEALKLIEREIGGAPYDETFVVPQEHSRVDGETSTLSLELRSTGYARVSLIAVELSYET
jgi:hypothetical protein